MTNFGNNLQARTGLSQSIFWSYYTIGVVTQKFSEFDIFEAKKRIPDSGKACILKRKVAKMRFFTQKIEFIFKNRIFEIWSGYIDITPPLNCIDLPNQNLEMSKNFLFFTKLEIFLENHFSINLEFDQAIKDVFINEHEYLVVTMLGRVVSA
jgi:hypothetical protein